MEVVLAALSALLLILQLGGCAVGSDKPSVSSLEQHIAHDPQFKDLRPGTAKCLAVHFHQLATTKGLNEYMEGKVSFQGIQGLPASSYLRVFQECPDPDLGS